MLEDLHDYGMIWQRKVRSFVNRLGVLIHALSDDPTPL